MENKEKIKYAKMFVDKLARGVNPIDDTNIPEGDVVNNVHISRCLFYVSEILQQVISDSKASRKSSSKPEFQITLEELKKFQFSDIPITISEITKRLNMLVDLSDYKSLKYSKIMNWLIDINALEITTNEDGKNSKIPTQNGIELGIITEERERMGNRYKVVLYKKEAQKLIVDNLPDVLEHYKKEK